MHLLRLRTSRLATRRPSLDTTLQMVRQMSTSIGVPKRKKCVGHKGDDSRSVEKIVDVLCRVDSRSVKIIADLMCKVCYVEDIDTLLLLLRVLYAKLSGVQKEIQTYDILKDRKL